MLNNLLSLRVKLIYAAGMLGWSILTNIISVVLVYFYLPPSNSGLNNLLSQQIFCGVFNIMAIITASCRLFDAVTDPIIAQLTDKNKNPKGRRITFMRWFVLPAVIFTVLIFFPITYTESAGNVKWLLACLVLFYISTTGYIIPYYALMPEIAKTEKDKISLSTFQSLAFVLGIIISSQTMNIASLLQGDANDKIGAIHATIIAMAIISGIFLLIPVLFLNEKKLSSAHSSHTNLLKALKETFRNRNFMIFIAADFSYFMAITIITNGMLYYVTVLLGLDETVGGPLMGVMVLASLLFYPFMKKIINRVGKKKLVTGSFMIMSAVFVLIFFLGKLPLNNLVQVYILALSFAVPLAVLGILPNVIISSIIQEDSAKSGDNREGMFFAVRFLFDKLGQTLGIAVFSAFTLLGKDPGNDMGIRVNGLLGAGLCVVAGFVFTLYKEKCPENSEAYS